MGIMYAQAGRVARPGVRLAFACLILAAAALGQSFTNTATGMITARAGQTAILLPNGNVLLAGGVNQGTALASAEIYDPASGTFTATGNMGAARVHAQAQLLPNGKVLLLGGVANAGVTSTELYDPASGTFAPGPALPTALDGLVTVPLSDGRIWVTGLAHGCNRATQPCSSPVEIYDPASNAFTAAGALAVARTGETATLLGNGTVLIVGGYDTNSLAATPSVAVEIYDPRHGASAVIPAVSVPVSGATAVALSDGDALICGGASRGYSALAACELYNASAQTIAPTTGTMTVARCGGTMTRLQDGTVLVAGGNGGTPPDAEIYTPALQTFSSAGNFNTERSGFSATLLSDGTVLLAGGASASAEIFQPGTPTPAFSLGAAPTQATASAGTTAMFTVAARGANGFSDRISLSCANTGAATCAFAPAAIAPGETSTLTLDSVDSAAGAPVRFQVVGTSGSLPPQMLDLQADLEAPAAKMSASALGFGSQPVGAASASQTVTLVNGGKSALNISGIAAAGDFAETNNCGASLASGGPGCAITVIFDPTAVGSRTGALWISDNGPSSPQSVTLSGSGVAGLGTAQTAPSVSFSPSSLTFGDQTVNTTSAAQTITMSNTGDATLVITSPIIAAGNFTESNTCGTSVAAGSDCVISVTFSPTEATSYTGEISVTDNAAGSPQTVNLAGIGVGASTTGGNQVVLEPASGGATSATVTPGQTATYNLLLASNGTFTGAVTIACAGAPANSTCVVDPDAVTVTLGTQTAVTVSVVTTAASSSSAAPPGPKRRGPLGPAWPLLALALALAPLGMAWPLQRHRTWRRAAGSAALGLGLAFACAACGGGNSSSTAPPPGSGTPSGNYTLTVTASSNNTAEGSIPLTLMVQ